MMADAKLENPNASVKLKPAEILVPPQPSAPGPAQPGEANLQNGPLHPPSPKKKKMKRSCIVKCCRWWFNYRRLSTMLRWQQALAVALILLLGILRLIFLREIPYYIHRLFAFYFIFFGLTMLFVEAESRPA